MKWRGWRLEAKNARHWITSPSKWIAFPSAHTLTAVGVWVLVTMEVLNV
jgi:hypothetical protein